MPSILPLIVVFIICTIATTTVGVLALVRYLNEGAGLWTLIWGGVGCMSLFMMYQAISGLRKILNAE